METAESAFLLIMVKILAEYFYILAKSISEPWLNISESWLIISESKLNISESKLNISEL